MSATFWRGRVSKHPHIVLLSAVAAIAVILFALGNLAPLNQNDFMYAVAPVVRVQNGDLYTNVPFLQAPVSIQFNSMLVAVTGDANIFLLGRAVSMLLVLLAVLLPVLTRSKLANIDIWVVYVALCLTNLFVVTNSSEIGNYSISLLFLSAAVTVVNTPGSAVWRGFAACVCTGLAISTKLYFIIICPGLLLYFLLTERSALNWRVLVACGLGFLVGLAPILFFMARDFQSFMRWNVQVHQLILLTRVTDPASGLLRIGKFTSVFVVLMSIPIGFVVVAAVKTWRRGGREWRQTCGTLVLLTSAGIMAISPVYVFEQYFGPLAFLLFLFSAPWNSTRAATRRYVILGGVMLCIQSVILAQSVSQSVTRNGNLGVAQVLKLQSHARQIVVNDYNCERKLYTSAPLFLLENDVRYPPELAAGPFLMFLREALARKGEEFDLNAHIQKWNPDVVMWGYYLGSQEPNEDAVDRIIRDYAIHHAFVVTTIGQIDGRVIELGYRAGCKTPPRP